MTATSQLPNPETWLQELELDAGKHDQPDAGMCWMEAIAYSQGEDFTDHPQCVSPVIAAFGRNWQDALNTKDRQRLIKPLFWDVVGTHTNNTDVESELAWMATDWLVRTHTPTWLRLAGLTKQADTLAKLNELTPESTPAILLTLIVVRSDANAARVAAWDAAWAARDAGRDAAGAAAGDAAWGALQPTIKQLQQSAQDLVRRMCAHAKAAT